MKEHLRQLAARADTDLARGCLVREYLKRGCSNRYRMGARSCGGFSWAVRRCDFCSISPVLGRPRLLPHPPGEDAGVKAAMTEVKRALGREGYPIEVKVSDRKTVASAWIRFPGLPHDLGLSPHASQTLSIKVEVDTNPPPGARIETSVVRRHVTLHLCHHDKASLLAGKLHAVLSRPWAKGRDLYDLVWYLADRTWPAPNLDLLNAALAQTEWKGPA